MVPVLRQRPDCLRQRHKQNHCVKECAFSGIKPGADHDKRVHRNVIIASFIENFSRWLVRTIPPVAEDKGAMRVSELISDYD
jgi:hypothetical protein